jgi:hemerythrin superfamily protein
MPEFLSKISPNATNMIRMDHTHVMAVFHRYKADTPPAQKQALVNTACTALEIHAELEEEIFYPAVREVTDNETIRKSVPEHNEMRQLIATLRGMTPDAPGYDDTFMALMRDVIHHVADEETVLLPEAERMLPHRLDELGAAMTRRRMQLLGPRVPEVAVNLARGMPMATMALAGLLVLGVLAIVKPAHRTY